MTTNFFLEKMNEVNLYLSCNIMILLVYSTYKMRLQPKNYHNSMNRK